MKKSDAKLLKEKFTGYSVEKETQIELDDMENLILLGHGIAIEYEARKHSDRTAHIYRHEFENACLVLTNGKEIIIFGKDIQITEKGIEG